MANVVRVSGWYSKCLGFKSELNLIFFSSTDVFFSLQTANVNLNNHLTSLHNAFRSLSAPYLPTGSDQVLKVAKVWEYGYLLPTGLEQVLCPDPILSQGMWSGNETREVGKTT